MMNQMKCRFTKILSGERKVTRGRCWWSSTVCPFFGHVQPAVDTTLVSALKEDGEPRRDHDGVALAEARRNKERMYPELVGPGSRARLVVLALEVVGRWVRRSQDLRPSVGHAASRGASFDVTVVRNHLVRRSKIVCCIPDVVAGVGMGPMGKCLRRMKSSVTKRWLSVSERPPPRGEVEFRGSDVR